LLSGKEIGSPDVGGILCEGSVVTPDGLFDDCVEAGGNDEEDEDEGGVDVEVEDEVDDGVDVEVEVEVEDGVDVEVEDGADVEAGGAEPEDGILDSIVSKNDATVAGSAGSGGELGSKFSRPLLNIFQKLSVGFPVRSSIGFNQSGIAGAFGSTSTS